MAFTPLSAGTILSKRYKIVDLIRRGGMGATYRGEDLEIHKPVAVKQLLENFETPGEREAGISNFLAEMAVLKSIHHPQIPKILDHFVSEHGFFFVLEFVEGSDFTRILEDSGRGGLPSDEVIRIGIQLCRVLSYLHERQPEPIVHLDIKSSNVMKRTGDGRILLLDFGIARAHKPGEGMMIGTPGYASPEQHAQGGDPRSDIFSLGATLHELATGRRPDPESFAFLPPHELRPELSPKFSEVILQAVQYHPQERFQNARDFEESLLSLLPTSFPPEEDSFRESLRQFQKEILLPGLTQIKAEYPSESQHEPLPSSLDHFTFTLGAQILHSLIIDTDESRQVVAFHLKQGLLPAKLLGEISPANPGMREQFAGILKRFLESYRSKGV